MSPNCWNALAIENAEVLSSCVVVRAISPNIADSDAAPIPMFVIINSRIHGD